MEKWKSTSNYMGDDMSEHYILYSKTRDSDPLERSNFDCILRDIDPNVDTEKENENIIVVSFRHWACGWVETIMIHESEKKAIAQGNDIQTQLNIYPVYDDDHYDQLKHDEAQDIWKNCLTLAEKIEICQTAKISIFSARSETIPAEVEYNNI